MERGEMTILVTGGTGRQGGAAARHLLADGWTVRALVRDPDKPEARALEQAGATLAVGDMLDRGSLTPAVAGAYGVFSVQTFRSAGVDGEIAQARNLIDAAGQAGVTHFVQNTVYGAHRDAGMPWVVSKHQVEAYLRESHLPTTIWRPVTFMENYLTRRDDIMSGHLHGPDAPDAMRNLIAVDDIGRFVALAFSDPDTWIGRATEIAGDRMANSEIARVFTSALDLPVIYEQAPMEGMPEPKPDAPDAPPLPTIDLVALRSALPGLRTLDEWLRATW
jgi:uncharacterized protein YbjT (DUF2867 family)